MLYLNSLRVVELLCVGGLASEDAALKGRRYTNHLGREVVYNFGGLALARKKFLL
jgi:hypothetical protein